MPKEFFHWTAARRTAQGLKGSAYQPALEAWPLMLELGASFHDSLYYLQGAYSEKIKKLPCRLHGVKGEGTFDLLRLQLEHVQTHPEGSEARQAAAAAFVGMLSHVFLDATVHPFVYFHSGAYDSDDPETRHLARIRHRALESAMDIALAGGPEGLRSQSLQRLLASRQGTLIQWLPEVFCLRPLAEWAKIPQGELIKAFASAFRVFSVMQRMSRIRLLSLFLRKVDAFLPRQLREITPLFYAPQYAEQSKELRGVVSYTHPVSGEPVHCTLEDFLDDAVERSVEFALALEDAAISDVPAPKQWAPGPSMGTGLSGVGDEGMRYFAEKPLIF